MNNTIFRKSSIDRLKSPEQLNEYIRVARPGVWLLLSAIILLLVGVLIWGVFGTVESRIETGVFASRGLAVCFVSEENAEKIAVGMQVQLADTTATVRSVSSRLVSASEIDPYLLHLSGLTANDFCRLIEIDAANLYDGIYPATITVERIHPVSFVIH